MNTLLSPLVPLGRLMLCAIFFMSTVANKIPQFQSTVEKMTEAGVPYPSVALVGAIVFLIVGSISVVVGLKARVGALLLLVFLIAATYYFHDFWNYQADQQQAQMIQFMKNLGLAGGVLLIIGNGPGPWSLDGHIEKRLERAKGK